MEKKRRVSALCSLFMIGALAAQTFEGAGGPIPDDGNMIEFQIMVNGLSQPLDTVSFGLEQVCITAEHTWLSQLEFWLLSPSGTTILLTSSNGWNANHYTNTCFRHEAGTSILNGEAPYTGTFRPIGGLGRVNDLQNGNGIWTLRVLDTYPGSQIGSLAGWSITFGNDPTSYDPFISSELPIVVIDTGEELIPNNNDRVMGTMFIVDNGPGAVNHAAGPYNNYMGHIGIKRRGQSSKMAPKKSFSIELWDMNGESIDGALLGMPPHEDWALIANHFDKTLLNNSLTYTLAGEMGHYSPRHRHVEVVVNGDHHGVYMLVERIKRDSQRVNVAKMDSTDISGDAVTGGYIIKLDKANVVGWGSSFPPPTAPNGQQIYYHYHYPRAERIMPEQAAYIQGYMDSFETALAGPAFVDPVEGYAAFIDVPSFVDLFLINELSRDVDGYRISTFMHKNRNSLGGKLRMGPFWDYDIAWGNVGFCQGFSTTGWAYEYGNICPDDQRQIPFWWSRLLEDPVFQWQVRCRWEQLRQSTLSTQRIHQFVDSMVVVMDNARQRNFQTWPVLGHQTWSNPEPIPTTYDQEIQALKTWVTARAAWLDQNLPMTSSACTVGTGWNDVGEIIPPFPNPFHDHILLQWPEQTVIQMDLLDVLGRRAIEGMPVHLGPHPTRVDLPQDLPPGTYVLRLSQHEGPTRTFRLLH